MTRSLGRRGVLTVLAVLLLAAVLGVVVGTVGKVVHTNRQFGSLAVEQQALAVASPQVPEPTARATALQELAAIDAKNSKPVTHYTVKRSQFVPGLLSVKDRDGNMTFSTGRAFNAHVLQMAAPGDGQYRLVKALVVINADTGQVEGAQVARWNP